MFYIQSGKKEMNKAIKFTCCKKLDERNDGEVNRYLMDDVSGI